LEKGRELHVSFACTFLEHAADIVQALCGFGKIGMSVDEEEDFERAYKSLLYVLILRPGPSSTARMVQN